MRAIYDKKYRFAAGFNPDTGFYYRTNVKDHLGGDTGTDAFMASYPHLIDVGIMGHCEHGKSGKCLASGIECYQDGLNQHQDNMKLSDFETIVEQSKGRVFQFALGGRGDPDQHEHFAEILAMCMQADIVPNFTTSGVKMTADIAKLCAKYCGAVAVSWQRASYTMQAIDTLLRAGVETNIHFVLSTQSIDEAISLLHTDSGDISRIVFLLHKPVGLASKENVLTIDDERVVYLFELMNRSEFSDKTGFDSCAVPGLLNYAHNVHTSSIESCEGARFSAYISADMVMVPCSFDQKREWAVDLRTASIEEAWMSEEFEDFRSRLRRMCPDCDKRDLCLGGCPIEPDIVLCNDREVTA